jgi:hypothetical protein
MARKAAIGALCTIGIMGYGPAFKAPIRPEKIDARKQTEKENNPGKNEKSYWRIRKHFIGGVMYGNHCRNVCRNWSRCRRV